MTKVIHHLSQTTCNMCIEKAARTSVDAWKLPPEVDQGRELVDAVLLGVAVVVHLHEGDVQRVGLLELFSQINLLAIVPKSYRVYQRFGQTKLPYGGLVLCSSQFQVMTRPPLKLLLMLKMVKSDIKIIIFLLLLRLSLNTRHTLQDLMIIVF